MLTILGNSVHLKGKYTQFRLTVKMKDLTMFTYVHEKEFLNVSYKTETAMFISSIWLLVGPVRSL